MKFYTINELALLTKYSKHTIYTKKKSMKEGLHYFQVPKGKIRFSEKAISFLLNVPKENNEDFKRHNIQKEKQSVSIHKYFN